MRLFTLTKTQEQEYNDLGQEGYNGNINDRVFNYLRDQGHTGSYNDKLRKATQSVPSVVDGPFFQAAPDTITTSLRTIERTAGSNTVAGYGRSEAVMVEKTYFEVSHTAGILAGSLIGITRDREADSVTGQARFTGVLVDPATGEASGSDLTTLPKTPILSNGTVGIAYDPANGCIWWRPEGVWSVDPSLPSDLCESLTIGSARVAITPFAVGTQFTVRTASHLLYTPPAGFTPLVDPTPA